VTPLALSCAPYVCGAGGACDSGCNRDSICMSGSYCTGGGQCRPKKTPGNACAGDHECVSGHCANQVCCESACIGPCESCNRVSSMGQCTPLSNVDGGLSCGTSLDASWDSASQ
jgi:hypothetical protein